MDINAINQQLDNIDNSTKAINASTATIRQLIQQPTNTIPVNPGDNLASIVDSAPSGAILSIDPAFTGNYDLLFNKPITLTNKVAPPPGRVNPQSVLPKIGGTMVFGAPSVSLLGISLTGVNPQTGLVQMGDSSLIGQCLFSGSPNGQHRAIWADAKNQTIADSYIYNIWLDIDTQAIFCYNGCKGLSVTNTYLEAASENFLAGGADASSVDNIPQDIVFDNCDFNKPLAWKDKIAVKNLFELKCAKKVTLKNSRLTNSWASGQVGYGILINVRNQDGAAPFSVIEDVVIDGITMANVGAGFSILGTDYLHPSGSQSRLTISNSNIQLNTDLGASREVFITRGSDQFKLINNNFTYIGANEPNSFFSFDDPTVLSTGFEFDGNDFVEGDYGIFGTGAPNLGLPALTMYAPGYACNNNTVRKGTSGRTIQYPSCISLV